MVLHMTRPLFVGFQPFAGHVKGSQPIKRKEKNALNDNNYLVPRTIQLN